MDKNPVLKKAEELAKALKNANREDPLEFNELIVKCNQIIESRTGLDYGGICAVSPGSGSCCR